MSFSFYEDPNCFEQQFGEEETLSETFGISIVNPLVPTLQKPTKEEEYEILRCFQERE